ncbi:MAG: hypothetical protein L0206_15885, partial [Actinobacteria bacterium]|nr:hypothetical protein [Actinomycetota bacterium]
MTRTEPLGDGRLRDTRFFYEAPGDPTDRDLSRVETRNESGAITSTVEYLYDALGRRRTETVLRRKSWADPTLVPLVTETVYNARNQIVRLKRPDGTTLVVQYDGNGNPERRYLEERRPDGQLVLHDDTQLVYDAMDRLVAVIDAAGETTEYGYDASGNRVSMRDPEDHVWRFEYDPMNRPVRVIDPNGAVTETVYDEAGRVVETIDPTGISTTRGYDEIGRLVSIQQGTAPPATRTVFYAPVPSPCSAGSTAYCEKITDPEGRTTTYAFDDLGRVFRVTDAATPAGVTQISYDLPGQVRQVTDPVGKFHTFEIDTRGRVVSAAPPYSTLPTTYAYDETGNVISQTNPDGCVLETTYDVMGRLTRRKAANAAGGCANRPVDDQYGYDARGLLVAATNPDVGLVREYDLLGRLTREIDDRFGRSVGYAWDGASRLASKVYPDGTTVHYAYDGAGRSVGISDPFGDTTRFLYDAAGRRVQKRGISGGSSGGTTGLRTDYAYDGFGRLTSLQSFDANGSPVSRFAYPTTDYDAVGNRKRVEDTTPPATPAAPKVTLYTYDDLDRLESVDPPDEAAFPSNGALLEFTYDAAGNRLGLGPPGGAPYASYGYDARKRLTTLQVGGTSASLGAYEGAGNPNDGSPGSWTPPGGPARTLKYDALGRLVTITGGFSATYVYDPFGRRIKKTET